MKNKKINELKDRYNNIEIPKELDNVIENAFDGANKKNRGHSNKNLKRIGTTAAALGIVVASVNMSPSFAQTLEEIPVIGSVIKVINFDNYKMSENGIDVSIAIPGIKGTGSKELEYKLNEEFKADGKKEYEKYKKEADELKAAGENGHKDVNAWYEVINENDDTLSLAYYNSTSEASSELTRKIYNIDKKEKTVLTLKGMFGNSDYVDLLSRNILEQMKKRTEKDPADAYFVEPDFKIKEDQNFYINKDNNLVICFDKYEVAPGSSGLVEFVIPTNVVEKLMK